MISHWFQRILLFLGPNISLPAVINITLQCLTKPSPPSLSKTTSLLLSNLGAERGAKWCLWVSWAVRWGIVPKRWPIRRIWKDSWETGKRHFKLDNWWAVGWLLVNGGTYQRTMRESTQFVSASKQCLGSGLAAVQALEKVWSFSPMCLLHVAFSRPLLSLLWKHILSHLWEQKLCRDVPESF